MDTSSPVQRPAPSMDRLNWLRAGILGANDGIVSVAAVVVGVAGAHASGGAIAAAGAAALVGGAVSMALGEYVSVSGQRDATRSGRAPASEDGDDEVSPWRAAWVSAATFTVGALLPFIAVLVTPDPFRIIVTVVAVLAALAVTGATGAALGGAPRGRATVRVLVGGSIALAATWGAGTLLAAHGM